MSDQGAATGQPRSVRPRTRPTTLHDVAARVGVSPRTVSRVVRHEGGFSAATRQRVLDAVAEMGYRPNAHARGLISGRSSTIGFVAPVISDPFFPELAEGVQRAARAEGLTLLFAISDRDPVTQDEVLASLEGQRPDGVVIFPAGDTSALVPFLDRGMPMVIVDAVIDHPNAISVRSDLATGTEKAVTHLLQRGCTRLAMLADVVHEVRRTTFVATVPADKGAVVIESDITMEGGRLATVDALRADPAIDGIFAFNDLMAIGALQAAAQVGRRVPDDLAVVGVDDVQMGAVVTPALTTVRIDRARVGQEAVRQVVALSSGEVGSRDVFLPVDLVVRESA